MKNLSSRKRRILLMDDEKVFRTSMAAMLEDAGYVCCGTVNGEEAVERFRKARERGIPFDVVLLDLHIMSGMGGQAAARKLLEIDAGARLILTSGDVASPVAASFEDYGFRCMLNKPFTMAQLYHALQQVLNGG